MNVLTEIGIKNKFLFLLDDKEYIDLSVSDSFTLGICKLEVKNGALNVYLRRPGLLIGRKGETLELLKKELGYDIKFHEVNLLTFN